MVRNKDLRKMRNCPDRELRRFIVGAAQAGVRYRMTKSGVMFYGDNGEAVTVHFTNSDNRAYRNAVADFRRIGYELPKKGTT